MIFVDTSALFAAADRDDRHHEEAASAIRDAVRRGEELLTHSLVVVETVALLHRRLGHDVAKRFLDDLDLFRIVWVDEALYRAGVERYARSGRTGPSLVDCVSFALIRRRKVRTILAFGHYFEDEDLDVVSRRSPE